MEVRKDRKKKFVDIVWKCAEIVWKGVEIV